MIYLFGGTSILGWNLFLKDQGESLVPFRNPHTNVAACQDWRAIDLEKEESYKQLFSNETPSHLIHCGGICDVDRCEANPEWAHVVNVESITYLLRYLPRETRLVYVSSDHVFSGSGGPYNEKSKTDPISIYGHTRIKAEQLILTNRPESLIIRVGLPIGPSADGRKGHLNWLQHRTKNQLPMTIVKDEARSAVWAQDCADRVLKLAQSSITGIRHMVSTKAVYRPALAHHLNDLYEIGAQFELQSRHDRPVPHLGHVELATCYNDSYSTPLPSVCETKLRRIAHA